MKMVKHKALGMGEIISREEKENSTAITVRFDCGTEMRLSIPDSFECGVVEALDSLRQEVDEAIEKRKPHLTPRPAAAATAPKSSGSTAAPRRKSSSKSMPSGPIATAYEKYLISQGYKVESDAGNPSTVYSYATAVESVTEEEGISWATLRDNISTIVRKYDKGGVKELFGSKSNDTVINALKRFEEFVDTL